MSQQIQQPLKKHSLHTILFITALILLIVSLFINAFEIFLVNNFIMNPQNGWNPSNGVLWIASLVLLFLAIILVIFAEYSK
jgi:hypothetical protein